MNTRQALQNVTKLTAAEEIFAQLREDIISLSLAPGAKLSEVEVARAHDVSRQPVREAFMRLGELNLLEIRPQRATRVRKISHRDLRDTRFVRTAIEVEIVRVACRVATAQGLTAIRDNLDRQGAVVAAGRAADLHALDYEFHRLICAAADRLPAFRVIAENKAHTDRVCMLELADEAGMQDVLRGHTAMFDAIRDGDQDRAVAATRHHLKHLDVTLAKASENHPDHFED
ncbi:GntR family transcriptional regulator [Microbulbifer sp. S227A]|uniref:GntR family transcriptional regulator n=1 Tax=Microbulbifer sp. S227A TaxID=3415131 RepID=UPI003C7A85CF